MQILHDVVEYNEVLSPWC